MRYNGEYIIAMGDTIDSVALINWLSREEKLLLPCLYLDNVKSFFPLNNNLNFAQISSFNMLKEYKKTYGALELYATGNDEPLNYQHFEIETLYKLAGLDYSKRDKYCTIKDQVNRIPQIEPPKEPYAFIPEGGSPGNYRIDREYVGDGLLSITPPQDALMLSYSKIIENATEIHCHATSWPRLIEKLPTKGKLFMHHYTRETNIKPENWIKYNVIKKEWNQLT